METNKEIVAQLKSLHGSLLGCKVGSVWKVNRGSAKIKKLDEYADIPQTPHRVFHAKRGHNTADYLMIVPDKTPVHKSKDKVGIPK